MILTVIALIIPTILGYLLISIILKKDDSDIIERICLSYPIGMGLLTMQMFLLGLLRIPLTLQYSSLPIFIELIILTVYILKKKIQLLPKISSLDKNKTEKSNFFTKLLILFLSIFIAAKVGSIFLETFLRPIHAWDSWANWSARAKAYYYSNSLLLNEHLEYFLGKNIVLSIISYPLHNPLSQVWISLWIGHFDEVYVKFWSPVYLLCITAYLYKFITKEINRIYASLIVIIFLSSPLLAYHSIEVYSDLTLSAYLFFILLSFINILRGKLSYLPIIGLLVAESLFIKDESLFFVIPLLISLFIFLWKKRRDCNLYNSLISLLIPILYIVPWYAFKFSHSLGLGAEHIRLNFVFHPEILKDVFFLFLSLDNFGILFIAIVAFLIVNGRPSYEISFILPVLAFYAMFFVMLYIFTSFYYEHFMLGTVFFRNVLTYYPSAFLLITLLIKDIRYKSMLNRINFMK